MYCPLTTPNVCSYINFAKKNSQIYMCLTTGTGFISIDKATGQWQTWLCAYVKAKVRTFEHVL